MPKPTLPPEQRRTIRIAIYVTPAERADLDRKAEAAGYATTARYLRELGLAEVADEGSP